MAFQTPRRLGPPRTGHSLSTVASSPNLHSNSTAVARKASLNALTGTPGSPGKMGGDGQELEVGDKVDVPGGMHGTVKFVGTVRGKKGIFAGVELSSTFAARGKNDGDVDGIHYFTTSVPGSGIFLPIHRAQKRSSTTLSTDSYPATPTTPSYSNYNNNFSLSTTEKPNFAHDSPSMPRFAQSVGPGAARPLSPQSKGKTRPSMPRPESPMRKTPGLMPTPSRSGSVTPSGLSKSMGPGRFNSPGPRGGLFAKPRTPGPSRPYSRNTNSRIGQHDTISEDGETTPLGNARGFGASVSAAKSRRPAAPHPAEEEVERLKKLLNERDEQLTAQAATLSEMEAGLSEIQNLMPPTDSTRDSMGSEHSHSNGHDIHEVAQLRALLREKNEKIDMLTAEFDNHRADFRSTIDTLELASTETERVYERKVADLEAEIRELHERGEDVESVANQLKQLEELVAELEEGLEDARRGEAEARGEVEFLRGEVERGRSELRREREKAAAALKNAGSMVDAPSTPGSRDLEQRDDEIRGLKAIIHSLSSGVEEHGRSPAPRQGSFTDPEELRAAKDAAEQFERENEELRGLVERKTFREEELEREVERLKSQLKLSGLDQRESVHGNGHSEYAIPADKHAAGRDSQATIVAGRSSPQLPKRQTEPARLEPMIEFDNQSSADGSVLWCEICETGGHDILNCTGMGSNDAITKTTTRSSDGKRMGNSPVVDGFRNLSVSDRGDHHSTIRPAALSPSKSPGNAPSSPAPPPFNPSASGLVPPKGTAVADPDKWCALCESEGHDVTACPNEDAY